MTQLPSKFQNKFTLKSVLYFFFIHIRYYSKSNIIFGFLPSFHKTAAANIFNFPIELAHIPISSVNGNVFDKLNKYNELTAASRNEESKYVCSENVSYLIMDEMAVLSIKSSNDLSSFELYVFSHSQYTFSTITR